MAFTTYVHYKCGNKRRLQNIKRKVFLLVVLDFGVLGGLEFVYANIWVA